MSTNSLSMEIEQGNKKYMGGSLYFPFGKQAHGLRGVLKTNLGLHIKMNLSVVV